MSTGDYILGLIGLAAIAASLAYAARTARRALLPDWEGPPALLADAILAIGLFTALSEILGLFGLLDGVLLVIGSVALGAAAIRLRGPGRAPERAGFAPSPQLAIAVAIAILLALQWAAPTLLAWGRGIYGGDSLWYHLPFAAHIAQSGSVTELLFTDPLYLNWFYPQNSELLHAGGILLFGNDFLSPALNLGWLGLALLAGWCVGRPYGAGAPTLAAAAALLSADLLVSRQPGSANNDVVAIALMLASAAILINASRPSRSETTVPLGTGPLLVAGLAAGLALGTKLTVVIPVAALTVGVVAITASGARLRAALPWGAGLAAGGGYWYMRNLVVSGNPLPWVHLGPLHKAGDLEGRDPYSIAHYLGDRDVWGKWFVPGLHERLGDLWPLVLVLAIAGVVLALLSGRRVEQMLAIVAGVSAIAYLLTPLGAAGPEGMPVAFRLNIRYLAPALALALVLVAIPPPFAREWERWWKLGAVGVFAIVIVIGNGAVEALDSSRLAGSLLIGLAVVVLPVGAVIAARRGVGPTALAAGIGVLVLALAVIGRSTQRDYLDHRYSTSAPDYPRAEHPGLELSQGLGATYEWARGVEDSDVALSGTLGDLFQYGLWGLDSSNRVRVIGDRGDSGSFDAIESCPEYLAAVNSGGYDYLVTTPEYDQDHPERDVAPAEREWIARAPSAERVAGAELVDVWRLTGVLDPAICTPS